jgi:hypothetical protein
MCPFSWPQIIRSFIPYLFLHLMQVTQADVKFFFETLCGEVCRVPCLMNLKLFIVLEFLSITY